MTRLTRKQQRLVRELDEIISLIGARYENVHEAEIAARTPYLESIKDQYIRSEIVLAYVLIDEFLGSAICHYFFGKGKSFIQLWRTKRFQNFNYYILENLYVLKKLDLVRKTHNVPRDVIQAIFRINDLRNALAHAFFPKNLRRDRTIYRSKDIYSLEGFKLFIEDRDMVSKYFLRILWGVASD